MTFSSRKCMYISDYICIHILYSNNQQFCRVQNSCPRKQVQHILVLFQWLAGDVFKFLSSQLTNMNKLCLTNIVGMGSNMLTPMTWTPWRGTGPTAWGEELSVRIAHSLANPKYEEAPFRNGSCREYTAKISRVTRTSGDFSMICLTFFSCSWIWLSMVTRLKCGAGIVVVGLICFDGQKFQICSPLTNLTAEWSLRGLAFFSIWEADWEIYMLFFRSNGYNALMNGNKRASQHKEKALQSGWN